jgi:hypothetical protein
LSEGDAISSVEKIKKEEGEEEDLVSPEKE